LLLLLLLLLMLLLLPSSLFFLLGHGLWPGFTFAWRVLAPACLQAKLDLMLERQRVAMVTVRLPGRLAGRLACWLSGCRCVCDS
jgi:hypothetical protein